jgi:hypothetical protein
VLGPFCHDICLFRFFFLLLVEELTTRDDVELLTVTKENRNQMASIIVAKVNTS